jgi:hypothetical protein
MRKLLPVVATFGALSLALAMPAVAGSAASTQVLLAGTGAPQTGAFTGSGAGDLTRAEFPKQLDSAAGPGAFQGEIVSRVGSKELEHRVPASSEERSKSKPAVDVSFEGLNMYQQRYARGGNQFSLEPPDQGLCVGNGYELEAVNDVLNVFDATGKSVLPDNTATNIVSGLPRDVNHAVDLNSFYGYAPAINRSTGAQGPFITDPSCLFDAATQRWFVAVLTLEVNPTTGDFTTANHLDLAVSKTAKPTGAWNIYRTDVTNDGTNTGGVNPGPYLGDYPHIGADANGFYITTNAYPWNSSGFGGAQIYAFSKAQLAAGAASVTMQHIDTSGLVNAPSDAGSSQPGFTVWPAQSPGRESFNRDNGGTEYFLSSNAAAEATNPVSGNFGSYTSHQLVVWTLTHTSSLNTTTPSVSLRNRIVRVNQYAIPPGQKQPGSGTAPTTSTPLGYCINDTTTSTIAGTGCWQLVTGSSPNSEVVSSPDSNDTRMQQVTYANGKLWGALDTAINPDGGAQRAGIAWYVLNPNAGKVVKQGYLGATGYDFTYPAIGVTASGRAVMAFTATGDTLNPSAAYAPIDAESGVGAWNIVTGGTGAAPDDGFTGYAAVAGSIRPRWGDYGAAAVDGRSIWIASEYVAHSCSYTQWGGPYFAGGSGDNLLGTCASTPGGIGTRTALANWSTRITKLTP